MRGPGSSSHPAGVKISARTNSASRPQKPLFSQIAAVAVRQVQIGLCQVIHIQSQFPSFPKIKSEKQEIYPYFTIKYKIEGRRMPSFLWKINNFFTSS